MLSSINEQGRIKLNIKYSSEKNVHEDWHKERNRNADEKLTKHSL